MAGKVYELLKGEGKVNSMEAFIAFQSGLLEKAWGTYTVHESLLK